MRTSVAPGAPPLETTPTEAVLWDVAALLISPDDDGSVFETLAVALGRLITYDMLWIDRVDLEKRLAEPIFAAGEAAAEFLQADLPPFGTSMTGRAALRSEALLVNDLHLDPEAVHIPGTEMGEPQSSIAVPLFRNAVVNGVLYVTRINGDHHFSRHEFAIVCRFAELAGLRLASQSVHEELEQTSSRDPLTQLHNRRVFDNQIRRVTESGSDRAGSASLILFDVDDFKAVNDNYGHDVGDEVLKLVAAATRASLRDDDIVCRVGGEEFAVILTGAGPDTALELAERIRQRIASTHSPGRPDITVSIGLAALEESDTAQSLYQRADQALYGAKKSGKNRVVTSRT